MKNLWSASALRTLREALRGWRSTPGFTLTAILTLGFTVGLAAAVFSVFDAVLVRPLPYGDPARLLMPHTYSAQGYTQPAAWPEYKFWREQGARVLDIAAYSPGSANLQAVGDPVPAYLVGATDNFFSVLAAEPLLGRTFLPTEREHGRTDVAVLSYALWRNRFGGRADAVGSKVELDGHPATIVGVMRPGFRFPLEHAEQLYVPLASLPNFARWEGSAGTHWAPTVARLRPGVSLAEAAQAMNAVLLNYARTRPEEAELTKRRMQLLTAQEALLGKTGGLLQVLAMAVLAVLLLGCVNIAGLMLARGLRRERELALRSALGASRRQLARQLLTELCLLALAGTVCGFSLAALLLGATRTLLTTALDRGAEIALNLEVFAAALGAALGTLLLAGLLPLRQILRVAPASALRSGAAASGTSRASKRLRAVFLATQVALAMLLLVTAGLLINTFFGLRHQETGFALDHLLTEEINLSAGSGAAANPYPLYYQPLLDKLRAVPGVVDAGMVSIVPLQSAGYNSEITIAGEPPAAPGQNTLAELRIVSPSYFHTMGAKLLRGRLLNDALDNTKTSNVVVNQSFVRRFFRPGEDPVGRKITNQGSVIVGVVSDLRQDLFQPPLPEFDQAASSVEPKDAAYLADMHLVLRTTLPPEQLTGALRRAMSLVDPMVPFRPAMTMDDVLGEQLTLERLENWLFGSFAALAVLLALVGLYGLVAQELEGSRRDIGIRMALGAGRGRVLRATLGRIALLTAAGLAVGGVCSFLSKQLLLSVIPGGVPFGKAAVLFAALAAAMELLALAIAFGPARRSASIDPVQVLRAE